jgi:hypothetical protein
MVIRRVGPLSCAKIAGTLYAVIGLFVGAIFSLIAMAGGFASNSNGGLPFGAMMGVGSIIFFPIMYGCLGFIGSLITAAIYNVVASAVGGVEVDLQ